MKDEEEKGGDLDDLSGLNSDIIDGGNVDDNELVDVNGDDIDPNLIDQSHVPTKDPPKEEKKDQEVVKETITHEMIREIWPFVIYDEAMPSKGRVNGEGYEIALELR